MIRNHTPSPASRPGPATEPVRPREIRRAGRIAPPSAYGTRVSLIRSAPGRTLAHTALAGMALGLGAAAPSAFAQTNTDIRFEQRIGQQLPLGTMFTDTAGARHALGAYFQSRPVVLYFGYARCPQLCSIVADGTNHVLRRLQPTVGRDFDVVAISIDPAEPAAAAREAETLQVRSYGRTGAAAGWHYLRGDATAIKAVADAAGFGFRYDPASRQFAHATGFLVATPGGVVSRYFLGVDFDAADVAESLQRAAAGETGESVYELVLLCFRGGGISGRYSWLIWRVLGTGVALTVVTLAGGIGWMLRQERRAPSHLPPS